MNKIKNWLPRIGLAVLMALVLLWATDSLYVIKAVRYNLVNIDDYKLFANRDIEPSSTIDEWPLSSQYNQQGASVELQKLHDELNSIAYLVIQNDSIVHESYWDGYSDTSISNSFSMAKSYVGTCIGIAIQEGFIKAVNQPIEDFIEEFKGKPIGKTPILHLLMMSSGSSWDESYINPFSMTTKAYYGQDLEKLMLALTKEENGGRIWSYKSGDTQLLALVLERASGLKLAEFVEKYIWKPTGSAQKAIWSLDHEGGREKAYCCLNSNARDFARIGQLYINNGKWKDKQILPASFVANSIIPNKLKDKDGKEVLWYGWQWWVHPPVDGHYIYYARGILGQYIICLPDLDMVIVRLGKKRGSKPDGTEHPYDVREYVKGAIELAKGK